MQLVLRLKAMIDNVSFIRAPHNRRVCLDNSDDQTLRILNGLAIMELSSVLLDKFES
jgi:hypothetical protein